MRRVSPRKLRTLAAKQRHRCCLAVARLLWRSHRKEYRSSGAEAELTRPCLLCRPDTEMTRCGPMVCWFMPNFKPVRQVSDDGGAGIGRVMRPALTSLLVLLPSSCGADDNRSCNVDHVTYGRPGSSDQHTAGKPSCRRTFNARLGRGGISVLGTSGSWNRKAGRRSSFVRAGAADIAAEGIKVIFTRVWRAISAQAALAATVPGGKMFNCGESAGFCRFQRF